MNLRCKSCGGHLATMQGMPESEWSKVRCGACGGVVEESKDPAPSNLPSISAAPGGSISGGTITIGPGGDITLRS